MKYIGMSSEIAKRLRSHKNNVNSNGRKQPLHLEMAKYGIENFKWRIIDECYDEDKAYALEMYYIQHYDTFSNGYNMTLGGKSLLGYKPSKESIKKSHDNNPRMRNTYQFDKKYNLIGTYISVMEASRRCGLLNSSIYRACTGEAKSAGGFYWSFTPTKGKVVYKVSKPIKKMDMNGNALRVYKTVKEAAKDVGTGESNIRNVLTDTMPNVSAKGFKWGYA